jgi:cysteine-S-conjugate beta-lyase
MSESNDARHPATLLTEVGRRIDEKITTANLPVYRASTVLFDSLDAADVASRGTLTGERHFTTYGTVGTPTTFALTDALEAMEGAGHAVRAALMPSGLAAISTALFAYLRPGDHMLMADSVYGPARTFAQGMLTQFGVATEFFDPALDVAAVAARVRDNTRVLYLESPGSYTFEIQDVPALAAMARQRGVISIIDNAWASPVLSRPFDWGIDVSLLPLTKYWSGHADVLMGAAVVREQHWPALWQAQRQLGICVGGDDAFLILRGLRTASVRLRRHESSALAVARWLQGRPEVARVLHPALPDFPGHALWRRDFQGSSGLFSFELAPCNGQPPGRAQLAALCENRRLFRIGYSWGGYESLIMPAKIDSLRTARPWTGGQLVRLHVGLEEPDDLIADLAEGLAAMARA